MLVTAQSFSQLLYTSYYHWNNDLIFSRHTLLTVTWYSCKCLLDLGIPSYAYISFNSTSNFPPREDVHESCFSSSTYAHKCCKNSWPKCSCNITKQLKLFLTETHLSHFLCRRNVVTSKFYIEYIFKIIICESSFALDYRRGINKVLHIFKWYCQGLKWQDQPPCTTNHILLDHLRTKNLFTVLRINFVVN